MKRLTSICIILFLMSSTYLAQDSDSNSFYDIYVNSSGSNIGRYTAATSTNHPVTVATGASQNVLFEGVDGRPRTSFNSIRSYNSNTDYVQGSTGITSTQTLDNLDNYYDSTNPIAGGFRSRWDVDNGADQLEILQDVKINGSSFGTSVIEVTMTVTNLNVNAATNIGIRYLWDFQIGADDGLPFTPVAPNGATRTSEAEFINPNFTYYYIEDNELNAGAPIFRVNGSVLGPSGLEPFAVAPTALRVGCWLDTSSTAFDYSVNSSRDIATTGSDCRGFAGGDTTILYYWGHDNASAINLAPQESFTARAFIFATLPSARNLTDTDGDALYDDWEINGFDFDDDGVIDVDLPALGADPNVPDIFVYYDWTVGGGDYQPSAATLQMVENAFAAQGINIHFIQGQAIPEISGSNDYNTVGGMMGPFYDWTEFSQIKSDYFPAEWMPIAHYMVSARALDNLGISGMSRNPEFTFNEGASDFLVTLGMWFFADAADEDQGYAGTIMHELGHNLGLGHGGVNVDGFGNRQSANHTNRKANHLSVMNYEYQTDGLVTRANAAAPWGRGVIDYSIFDTSDLATLNETNLDEPLGLGGSVATSNYGAYYYCAGSRQAALGLNLNPVNWNCDTDTTDTNVIANINNDGGIINQDFVPVDEWDHIIYDGGAIGAFGDALPELPLLTDTSLSPELDFRTYETIRQANESDDDGDGISNDLDACTWQGDESGLGVDVNGCPYYDADWDGFYDRDDTCPWRGDEGGIGIDETGCPYYDADGDGYLDRNDTCPWRADEYGLGVDDTGCPIEENSDSFPSVTEEWHDEDSDGDGDPNTVDACPWRGNEGGLGTDETGCPYTDADWDGVLDRNDTCPMRGNEYGLGIDATGCPISPELDGTQEAEPNVTEQATIPDADNDGIPDSDDQCPTEGFEAGTGIDETGCPLPE